MKKFLSIVIISLLLIFNIFFLIQNQNLEKEIIVLNQKIEELEKQEQKPVVEKIPEGWKEYRNEKYNYAVSYPRTIEIEDINVQQCGSGCLDAKEFFYISTFHIFTYIKPENNLEDYIENIFKNSVADVNSTKWIDVARHKGYQVRASVDYEVIYTYVIYKNYLYEISVINPENEKVLDVYDTILKSFRFID